MKKLLSKILVFLLFIECLTGCEATKRVAEDEYLLTDNTILVNGKKENSETINNLLAQNPNRKILGVPLRLHVYNLGRENRDSLFEVWLDKKPNRRERLTRKLSKKQVDKLKESSVGFNNWLRKTGEAPVIVNESQTKKSIGRFQNHYINNGWFDVNTDYKLKKNDNKRAQIEYIINTGEAFILDSISSNVKSEIVDSIYQNTKEKALIKSNEQYRTNNFEQERERISNELRNSGVYHFNQDYVTFEIDTVGTNKKVNVGVQIQNRAIRTPDSIRREPFKIYDIREVNIYTDYSYDKRNQTPQDTIKFGGYTFYSYGKMRYKPRALTDAIFITPGDIFRDRDRTLTYRHINQLLTFKYPNIEYAENLDNSLSSTIKLAPLKKFSLSMGADISQSNIQTIGFSVNPSLLIRNIFRGAETLQVSAIGSVGASKDKNNPDDPFFDINELGLDVKLTIPRLLSPFYTERIIPKYMSPNTRIGISTSGQTNIGLDKQTFTGTLNYNWFPNSKKTNRLDLFNIQYVRNINIDNYFEVYQNSYDLLNQTAKDVNYIDEDADLSIPDGANTFIDYALADNTPNEISESQLSTINSIDERKERLTENNLILSSSFSFTNDGRTNLFDENFSIFRFKVELAGNLLSTTSKLLGLEKDENDRYKLFNVAFSQYAKTELEYTKHWDLGKKNVLAFRSFFGIAIPYGNSTNIPFSKSFFAGGPNDNRAWTAYRLGPGSLQSANEFNEANLKLAFNLEQRFNIFENLNGALFVDAGNIWNALDDVEDERATFTSLNSLKDIAVGSGFGLRYDFSFFVFRFDIGFKTYDPVYELGNRWLKDYNFSNAVYNIGINYPF
ncbi:translocation and assembly module lipoprotein TamL [Seonamhaeicola maritimus]|uniref:BamA/TamA family outer membrane protein n=1 Tax=Seonamhaeicola maritimus TaxID=2591822 RepID=A0A5C7GJY3_9FLAO|nr:BamA/TamA family outer membrane protein [Seonamhaeicola maritimus]TXG38678.1 BamA/TamA family outer membrane protein [Seonamhaeicola maritimus]